MAFCDYCPCQDCQEGTKHISHAKTADGKNICDVCYLYDVCTSGPDRNYPGPCEDRNCRHRPKIVSEWTKLNG